MGRSGLNNTLLVGGKLLTSFRIGTKDQGELKVWWIPVKSRSTTYNVSTKAHVNRFQERFVKKNSYQPFIKMIVSCGAFKNASSGMVRSVHGTHPLSIPPIFRSPFLASK